MMPSDVMMSSCHLGLSAAFPGDAAHWPPVLAVVLEKIISTQADKCQTNFELCQCFDSEGLGTARVLRLLHVLKVYLLNIHGVVLLEDRLCPLDQSSHGPFEHVLFACLSKYFFMLDKTLKGKNAPISRT